jgi:UDP-3-O-[3-hydroxymyristoyl] glucosamine N-acyltransferase
VIGPNTEIHGLVEIGPDCRIGASVFVGTIRSGDRPPGRVVLGPGVRVGAGTIIENESELDLVIPGKADIPARSHVNNNGFGSPRYVG